MINIEQRNGSTVFTFSDNDRYLKNGEISVPVNSLSLSFDGSGFATFKKAATNDVFIQFFPENSNLATKENVINFYANNMVNIGSGSGSTSGGISDAPIDGKLYGRKDASWTEVPSGITAGEVDSKIATAVADLATDADLQAVSGKVDENTAAISSKQDTLVSGTNIKTVNGQALLGSGDISIQGGGVGQTYSGSTFGEIFNDYTTNVASGMYSHAEGYGTTASGDYSHAEGIGTSAFGANGSHAEGSNTAAQNEAEHAQGKYNLSSTGEAEADKTIHSIGIGTSFIDGKNAQEVMTNGDYYVLGIGGYDGTNYSDAQTVQEVISALTEASGSTSGGGGITDAPSDGKLYGRKDASWTEVPSGITAEDVDSKIATAVANLATDTDLQAVSGKVDENTAAIGGKQDTLVSGTNIKTVNGEPLLGSGNISIQGGGVGKTYQGSTNGEIFNDYENNVASGTYSHAEGYGTTASGRYGSHAEGSGTIASGMYGSHAEGNQTIAFGPQSHAEGSFTRANGYNSHAEGYYTETNNDAEHAQGKYNVSNSETIHSIGIGAEDDRKNAQEVMTNGDTYIYGIGGYDGKNYSEAQTVQEVISTLAEASGSTGGGGITDAPSDGKLYGRKDASWTEVPSGITAEDVDSKIATAVADLATDADLQAVSGKVDENTAAIGGKQDTLISGTNIKTVNGESLLGSGDITIQGGGVGQTYPDSTNGEIFNDYTKNVASGEYSHAEGDDTTASGLASHAEGYRTKASGMFGSHAEGSNTTAIAWYSHAEGKSTTARGDSSHAEGNNNNAIGLASHAEGNSTIANNESEHAQGKYNKSNTGDTEADKTMHSVGIGASSSDRKNAQEVMLNGDYYIYGIGGYDGTNYSAASTVQEVISALTEVSGSTSGGGGGVGKNYPDSTNGEIFNDYSNNVASGDYSHAEGSGTTASGTWGAHAEGNSTQALGNHGSHAEGYETVASGQASHAEGYKSIANGNYSHAEGSSSNANGAFAHAEGHGTIANNDSEHAEGSWNVSLTGESESAQTISTTGIGGADVNRKNARAIMKNGDCYVLGIGAYEGKDINSASSLQKVVNGKLNCVVLKENEYSGLGTYDITTLYIISEDNSTISKIYLGNVALFGA